MFLWNLLHLAAEELLRGVGVYYAECNGVAGLSEVLQLILSPD